MWENRFNNIITLVLIINVSVIISNVYIVGMSIYSRIIFVIFKSIIKVSHKLLASLYVSENNYNYPDHIYSHHLLDIRCWKGRTNKNDEKDS